MKLADVSIRRPVFATMMVAALVAFGIIGYSRVGVDLFPNVEFPFVTVTAVYPGADPEAVETKVVTKIEDAVAGISGIKELSSMSLENVGQIIIQFELERDVDQAAQEVRDKVSGVLRELPGEVEPPVVAKFDIGAAPVLSVVLSSKMAIRQLTDVADDEVKARLQKILGVGGIDLVGGRKREIQVWVRADQLEKHHMAVQDVFTALAAQNLEVPGGRFPRGQDELVVKTKGEVHSAEEIAQLIVPIPLGGAPVRVGDVARVVDATEEARSYSSLNGTSAVSLVVRKQSGTNTTKVASAIKAEVAAIKSDLAKRGIDVAVVADNSIFIENSVDDVEFDMLFGGFLAVAIILLFLRNFRTTLISAIAIPTSVMATFAFIYVMGFTINWMTLLALTLSIGILIDDAIVVIENIYRHMEEGEDSMKASHAATAEIGLAVMATTFSIVAVFVPVAFMKGMIGRFFYEFGLTVAVAVLISLFISFTLTPMLTSRFVVVSHKQNVIFRLLGRGLDAMDRGYRGVLAAALRHRALVLLGAVGILGLSVFLGRYLQQEFMAPMDQSEFNVKLQLPTGKGLPATRRYAEAVSAEIRALPGVRDVYVRVGGGVQQKVNEAVVYVAMHRPHTRAFTQMELMDFLRQRLSKWRGMTLAVEELPIVGSDSGMKNAPIQFNIRGQSLEEMGKVAEKLAAELRKIPGFVDVDTSYEAGKPELAVEVDRNKAAALGVPVASIATTVRALMGGDKATQLRQAGSLYDVRVRLQASDRVTVEDLTRLQVRSSLQKLVPLANLVTIKEGTGPTQINRHTRQRQVTVYANLQDKPLGPAIQDVERVAAKVVPAGFSTQFVGMGEIMEESFRDMFFALFLAVLIVYMILASQFESFVHPFTIMLSLPLSLVGAIGGLLAFGSALSIFAMIGIIMLMGLVTKNAILLVDYTNTLRGRGMHRDEALLKAGPVRLRPILMTTAAMVFGMLPVALGMGEGGESRAPMAVCVIGGLLTSTLLTLVVVPVVYSLLDGLAQRMGRREEAPQSWRMNEETRN